MSTARPRVFAYYSFVLGMTWRHWGVSVTTAQMRRTTLADGVFSFIFSIAVLAMSIKGGRISTAWSRSRWARRRQADFACRPDVRIVFGAHPVDQPRHTPSGLAALEMP